MKVVFHERYREIYAANPAAALGRLDHIIKELSKLYEFVEPSPAAEDDLLLAHTRDLVERFKPKHLLFEVALLAAGGAIEAARIALGGEPAFGLIRPPGHHASPNTCWGFCYFNNIAIAITKMRKEGYINKALIIDIDLHFGDGTVNIFTGNSDIKYYHLGSIKELELVLEYAQKPDLVAISAGFDAHVDDWGGIYETEDYFTIGKIIGEYAQKTCNGKVFGVLEGGYNFYSMAQAAVALLKGLQLAKEGNNIQDNYNYNL